jgi:hypothetical protein
MMQNAAEEKEMRVLRKKGEGIDNNMRERIAKP